MTLRFLSYSVAAVIGTLLVATPASAQCDPVVCSNLWPWSAARAEPLCLFDTVVWANPSSHVYDGPGARRYGRTPHGVYMCEADARAAGYKARR